ncbi:glycosyltransferase family 2 protein [Thermodesulfobacteriota bacterium]
MKVSVILPLYNGQRYLRQTLESIFSQTHRDIEVIVVDDGSTDGSIKLLSAYEDRIRVVKQSNRGVSAARNRGAEEARAELIAFIDQDDIWYRHKLETQISVFKRAREATFVYSDIDIIDSKGSIIARKGSEVWDIGWIRPLIKGYFLPLPSTIMMKRDLFIDQGGFSTDFVGNTHEDVEFCARLIQITDFDFIEEPLVRYRFNMTKDLVQLENRKITFDAESQRKQDGRLVRDDKEFKLINTITLYNKLEHIYARDPSMKRHVRNILKVEAQRQSHIGKLLAMESDFKEGRRRFRIAWGLHKEAKHLSRYLRACLPNRYRKVLFPK